MSTELSKTYDPASIEPAITERWLASEAFAAIPDDREHTYVIMMPLPNVTGALHMGHAMDNVMQDLLTRWHRMRGDNTLWMPGTDHAGIATQAVVEKRLFELEGKTRHDIGREALVQRIWQWKDQYQARIVTQQQAMGCSCDWGRQRFTMDAVCARAVRHTFFRMFRDGLIYRGNRLVNWDCQLQTAVADDEIVHEAVSGHFWHLRYPVIDPKPGEPDHVTVATTRPETMLGDTAVACHPDPAGELERLIAETRDKLSTAPKKERADLEAELERLEKRRETHLPTLEKLAAMARDGRKVTLPLQERAIPLICDEWAKPELGSGCVKITPAHDPNDYDVWTRHRDEIGIVNILNPDGTLNENAGAYAGQDRLAARDQVVADLEAKGLLEAVEDRPVEIGHSDRSKTPVEPYLSKQWFVRMGDVDGGIVCGRGTEKEFKASGLAQAAIDAVQGEWRSATGRKVTFHPDAVRYAGTYASWLAEKRDWCISRQLWWGHRIPVWTREMSLSEWRELREKDPFASMLVGSIDSHGLCTRVSRANGEEYRVSGWEGDYEALAALRDSASQDEELTWRVCVRESTADGPMRVKPGEENRTPPRREPKSIGEWLDENGFVQDPDVLDTWFSSAIWPHSTLGWPDPETAEVDEGQAPLGGSTDRPDCLSYYYPGSCLVTGRDIITLWIARMVVTGLYNLGDVPFTDVFVHANIQDGKGERMSKSKGNGIDPVDIIEKYGTDAMRYVLCEMQTGTQDIRLPVQAISPFTGKPVDLATAKHGHSIFTYMCPESGKEFDVLGTMKDVPAAKLVSDRFDVGRNFCNKLWNAARFALMNLEAATFEPRELHGLALEDRWILSRLARAIGEVEAFLEAYNPSAAIGAAREFFWSELCDWYLEFIKPRMQDAQAAPVARQVLATAMDQILRLLHPFVPFITEAAWAKLNELAPQRGIREPLPMPESGLCIHAPWPGAHESWRDETLDDRFDFVRDVVRAIRDVRNKYNVPPSKRLDARIRAAGAAADTLKPCEHLIRHMAGLDSLELAAQVERPGDAASAVVRDVDVYVCGVVDVEQEKGRLTKQRNQLAGQIAGTQKKLANENFINKAKPEVVDRERQRLTDLKNQLEALDANLRALEG
jgi:valyl-tRNA synthetase